MLVRITERSKQDQETWWFLRAIPRTLRVEPWRVVKRNHEVTKAQAFSTQFFDNEFLQSLCNTIGSISVPVFIDNKLSNRCG